MIKRTLLVILMVLCPLGLTLADDWPQWRGPDRTDVSKETGLLESWPPEGPKLLWTFRNAGEGYSCPAIVGDRLYCMGSEGAKKDCVYAVDLKTQKKLWSVKVSNHFKEDSDGDGPRGTPTIDGGFLYALSAYGDLVCVDTTSGRKVWSQRLSSPALGGQGQGHGWSESPLIDRDLVVVTIGGSKGAIVAFDKKTGKLKWRSTTLTEGNEFRAPFSSMIAIEPAGVRQYVQVLGDGVVGVRASDGEQLWKFPYISNGLAFTPIYQNDCVYISSIQDCVLLKLISDGDKFKTERIYINGVMRSGHQGAVLIGDYIYGFSGPGNNKIDGWICQDFKSGKAAWSKNPNPKERRDYRGSLTYADGNLYCYHEKKGDVLLLKATPTGYQEQGKFRIPEQTKIPRGTGRIYTHPVVANGKLYLRDQDLIFCYNVRKPSP